jgi:hypothetical protein
MSLEEVDDAPLLPRQPDLVVELRPERESVRMQTMQTDDLSGPVRSLHLRCRSALRGQKQRAQANEYGSQNVNLLIGDRGATPTPGPLVSLARGTLAEAAAGAVTPLTVP